MNGEEKTQLLEDIVLLGQVGPEMGDADVDALMERVPRLFRLICKEAGYDQKKIQAVITKFRDSGRRSPPRSAFSKKGPGRPKDGKDGNRANRWELQSDHKYYATKRDAQLVEIKYYLQALSFEEAPTVDHPGAAGAFTWLLGHELKSGEYNDPILLRTPNFKVFLQKPRLMTSGHLVPLARGGMHQPGNTYLMLDRANTMQNDLTFDEFMAVIDDILRRQGSESIFPDSKNLPSDQFLEGIASTVE